MFSYFILDIKNKSYKYSRFNRIKIIIKKIKLLGLIAEGKEPMYINGNEIHNMMIFLSFWNWDLTYHITHLDWIYLFKLQLSNNYKWTQINLLAKLKKIEIIIYSIIRII